MITLYKALIAYKTETPDGKLVTKKDNILIEALSFTEAEMLAYQIYLDDIISSEQVLPDDWTKTAKVNDFTIKSLMPQEIEKVIGEHISSEHHYRVKVSYKEEKSKKMIYYYVCADNIEEASKSIITELSTWGCDTCCESIILTNVSSIWMYSEERAKRAVETNEKLKEKEKEFAENQ